MREQGARRWGRSLAWMAAFFGLAGCQVLFGIDLPGQSEGAAASAGSVAGMDQASGGGVGGRAAASGSDGSGSTGSGGAGVGAGGSVGGTGGSDSAGGSGAAGVPGLPLVLGCAPWLPSDPGWVFAGDARAEAERIVLTPLDAPARQRWGQAYLSTQVDPENELEVSFTFLLEPPAGGDAYAQGAAFWFAPASEFPPATVTVNVALGVPLVNAGVALALDMRAAGAAPSWGLYDTPYLDGRNLSGVIVDGITVGSSALAAGAPARGPHTARLRMRRNVQPSGEDDVDLDASFVSPPGAGPIASSFQGGEDEVFAAGVVGFSAGSAEGVEAVHSLLGAELKIDGVCLSPPPAAARE